jgi:hypothetical protein
MCVYQTTFTNKRNFVKEAREAAWAAGQQSRERYTASSLLKRKGFLKNTLSGTLVFWQKKLKGVQRLQG